MAAIVTSNKFRITGIPGIQALPLALTSRSTTTTESGVDSDKDPGKHAIVHKLTVNGQEVDILFRVQFDKGCLFIDAISDQSIGALSTTVAAMNLTGIGHPSPQKDAIDTQALVAAGGS